MDREQLAQAFQYLDDLRESGRTNMFGAQAYVAAELGYEKREALDVTMAWTRTFDGKSSLEDRVTAALARAQEAR